MDPQTGLLPSIVDRLTDPESRGTKARSGYTIEQMAEAIEADLEWLLNTHSDDSVDTEMYPRFAACAGYGLPDLAALTRLKEIEADAICGILEAKIARYEPRLKDVQVTIKGEDGPLKIQLHLRAVLAVDPSPEMVFDKTLDLASGFFASG
ncbi:MAG: type VI secretion system baseplate subunit TssE [Planctomycetes bacterium]|nr:type VI secretion system baseplate subunit TssE [Planctomycetota bacterium]